MTNNEYKIYTFYNEQKYSTQKSTCILKMYFKIKRYKIIIK